MANRSDIVSKYHEFGKYAVYMETGAYCAGCLYYLHQTAIEIILRNEDYFKPFPKETYTKHLVTYGDKGYFQNIHLFEDKTIGLVLHKNGKEALGIRDELIHAINWEGI